jgi:hypothetical protein
VIIDCHTHLNHYTDETADDLAGCLQRMQQAMRRNRVDVSLVLTSYKISPGRPSARTVVEATRHLPNIHVVAGVSWRTLVDEHIEDWRQLLQAGELKGLKLYPGYEPFYPADVKLAPVY